MRRALVFAAMLAGCAPVVVPPPPPGIALREVTLYRDTIVARTSDGALCTGVRAAQDGPWQTTLSGCLHAWPVAVLRPAAQARQPLAPATGDPWVVITTPDGGRGFAPVPDPTG